MWARQGERSKERTGKKGKGGEKLQNRVRCQYEEGTNSILMCFYIEKNINVLSAWGSDIMMLGFLKKKRNQ